MRKTIKQSLPKAFTPEHLRKKIDWMVNQAIGKSNLMAIKIDQGDFTFHRDNEQLILQIEIGKRKK